MTTMQCVILAAGKGTRMRPLTENKPKPMVEVNDTPLIEHVAGSLPEAIDEIIIVVGYKGEHIKEYCGDEYMNRPVSYVEQEEKMGTAHALFKAAPHLGENFLVLNADDLVGQPALESAVEHDLCLITKRHETPEKFGVVELEENGAIVDIIEKPDNPPSDLVSTGAVSLDERVFTYDLPEKMDGEHFLSDILRQLAADYTMAVVEDPHWHPVGYPEDIPSAEAHLRNLGDTQ